MIRPKLMDKIKQTISHLQHSSHNNKIRLPIKILDNNKIQAHLIKDRINKIKHNNQIVHNNNQILSNPIRNLANPIHNPMHNPIHSQMYNKIRNLIIKQPTRLINHKQYNNRLSQLHKVPKKPQLINLKDCLIKVIHRNLINKLIKIIKSKKKILTPALNLLNQIR